VVTVLRRLTASCAVLAALALALPGVVMAHAQLEGVTPQRGAVAKVAPDAVAFRFDEAVEGNFGAVRVFGARGERVDAGDAYHPGGHGEQIAVHLKPSLDDGTYTATYRVVSADGHIVSGGSTFSVGRPGAAGATVADLLAGSDAGPVTATALDIGKAMTFAAIAIVVGGLAFVLWTWPAAAAAAGVGAPVRRRPWPADTLDSPAGEAFGRRLLSMLVAAALAGAIGAAAVVVLLGAQGAGFSGWSALDPDIVRETLGTKVGAVWGASVVVWVGVAALIAAAFALRRGAAAVAIALATALAYLVLVPSLGGHASTQHPVWLMLPANVIHVAAMALWAGGLVALVGALPAATRRAEPGERARMLAGALSRFSPMALAAVVALAAAGVAQAIVEVRTPAHLLDTAFGRAVLIKIVLLAALIAIGACHRRSSIPRLRALAAAGGTPGQAGVAVRRALRAEVALLVVVLAVTAALSSYPPSTAQTAGPFETTTTIGPAQLQVTVDPAAVGANQIHLYLLDPRDGRQWDRAKEVQVSAVQADRGIGPLREQVSRAGPGHYVVSGAPLGVPGEWTLRIAVRVSDFDQYERRIAVPIR
jgi:copper transport protein